MFLLKKAVYIVVFQKTNARGISVGSKSQVLGPLSFVNEYNHMKPPTNDYEALSSILFMAITSEDNSKYLTLAEQLCQRMNDIDIARAKRDILKKLDL